MSRIGKQPISIPAGVSVTLGQPGIEVTGPRGHLSHVVPPEIAVAMDGDTITLTRHSEDRRSRSMHGLTRTLIANMVQGVSDGFRKQLEVVGVGYKAEKTGSTLNLSLGYSHPIGFDEPTGISITVEKQTITVEGIDKCLVGETAAKIRRFRKPDVYKGKGIRYAGEVVRKKVGKAGSK